MDPSPFPDNVIPFPLSRRSPAPTGHDRPVIDDDGIPDEIAVHDLCVGGTRAATLHVTDTELREAALRCVTWHGVDVEETARRLHVAPVQVTAWLYGKAA